jgi:hypothetical protein
MPNEFLADITLTKAGLELIQTTLDRQFCEMAVALLQPQRVGYTIGGGKPLEA